MQPSANNVTESFLACYALFINSVGSMQMDALKLRSRAAELCKSPIPGLKGEQKPDALRREPARFAFCADVGTLHATLAMSIQQHQHGSLSAGVSLYQHTARFMQYPSEVQCFYICVWRRSRTPTSDSMYLQCNNNMHSHIVIM